MRVDTVQRYFKTKPANAPVDDKNIAIPAGKTVVIKAMDFTAPAQANAGVKILVGSTVIAASQGDKYMVLPDGQQIVGPVTVKLQLDNSNNPNGAFLGVAVYYEEV